LLRTDLSEQRLEAVRAYSEKQMPTLRYHNYGHVKDVLKACDRMADAEGIGPADRQLLKLGAYLHDIIYVPFGKQNEEASAEVAGEIMRKLCYRGPDIEKVKSMILATKLPTTPRNLLERILCDADLDNFGARTSLRDART